MEKPGDLERRKTMKKEKNRQSIIWACIVIGKIRIDWLRYNAIAFLYGLLRKHKRNIKLMSFVDYWNGFMAYYQEVTGESIYD